MHRIKSPPLCVCVSCCITPFLSIFSSESLCRPSGAPPPPPPAPLRKQAPDLEAIHRELFALREAKLALDQVVMPAPADPSRPAADRETTSSARRRGAGGAAGPSRYSPTAAARAERYQRLSGPAASARAGSRGGRAGDVAAARARAAAGGEGGGGTRRSGERRALAEMQIDPDLPLPLPTFPGHGKFPGGAAEQKHGGRGKDGSTEQQQQQQQQQQRQDGGLGGHNMTATVGGGGESVNIGGHYHGYFVPGVVVPRQRQSHGFPPELRAISTIPVPEKRVASTSGGAAAAGTGQRRRVRSRSTVATKTGRGATPPPPSRPPAPEPAAVTVAAASERVSGGGAGSGRGVSSRRPEPGSAAALASACEQRRHAVNAVNELRKEMHEREDRLERELEKLRQARSLGGGVGGGGALAATTAGGNPRPAPKAAPARTVAEAKRRAALASRGHRAKGRPRSRPLASRVERPPASDREAGEEERDQRDGGNPPTSAPATAATVIETADAQAQTAADGVQLFLHPQPSVRSALRRADDQRSLQPAAAKVPASAPNTRAQQTGRRISRSYGDDDGHYFYDDDGSFESSSVSEGYGAAGGGGGGRIGGWRLSPPPPVVFIEGEGRNASWRPSDDDRLLRRDGGSGGGGGGGGVGGGDGGGGDGGTEAMREVLSGGDARLILTAAAGRGDGGGDDALGGPNDASPDLHEIRLTTGRLEAAPESELEKLGDGGNGQDDVWVELAGMLAMTASDQTAGQPKPAAAAAGETPAAERGSSSSAEVPAVSQELVGLMREVVGQQKEMGEERSALMQVRREALSSAAVLYVADRCNVGWCIFPVSDRITFSLRVGHVAARPPSTIIFGFSFRPPFPLKLRPASPDYSAPGQALRAEVESRRVLLTNQELSLREREQALEKNEAEAKAALEALRLAAAAAAADAELRSQRLREAEKADEDGDTGDGEGEGPQQPAAALSRPAEAFWPPLSDQDVERRDVSEGVETIEEGGPVGDGAAPSEGTTPTPRGGGAAAEQSLHAFRCYVCAVCDICDTRVL